MTELRKEYWYILTGETCLPQGRTYREKDGILQSWEQGQWVTSCFTDLAQLKSFAKRDYPNHKLTFVIKEEKRGQS